MDCREHTAQEAHTVNWKEAKVVDAHSHYHQRCFLESWHIRAKPRTMNRDKDILPQTYNILICHTR